jgi:hypothetical protein
MSKRLQVLLDERELAELRALAARHGMTVSDWVRRAIASARRQESEGDKERKLAALRTAMQYSFPTGDIGQMLRETEQGYLGDIE